MSKIFLIFLVFFYKLALGEIKVNSIIKLDNNIPEECGLNFFLENMFIVVLIILITRDINLRNAR